MRTLLGTFAITILAFPVLGSDLPIGRFLSIAPSPGLELSGDFTARWDQHWLVRQNGVLTLYASDDQRGYRTIGTAKVEGAIGAAQLPVWLERLSPTGGERVEPGACIWIARQAMHPARNC